MAIGEAGRRAAWGQLVGAAPPWEDRLRPLLRRGFETAGGEPEAGIALPGVFRDAGIEPTVSADVQALPPRHPYLRLPLQFATGLDGLLRKLIDGDELEQIMEEVGPGRY